MQVGVQGVGGGGAGVAQGVEVVDEGDASVFKRELRDGEHVAALVEVVLGETVGEPLGLGVADEGLADVGDNLVSGGGFGESDGIGLIASGGLIALVLVEDAQGMLMEAPKEFSVPLRSYSVSTVGSAVPLAMVEAERWLLPTVNGVTWAAA